MDCCGCEKGISVHRPTDRPTAIARRHSPTVATRNPKDFEKPGLKVLDPSSLRLIRPSIASAI
jgi:hypothetical protein